MASVRKFSSWPLYFDKESKEEWKGRGLNSLKKLKALTNSALVDIAGVPRHPEGRILESACILAMFDTADEILTMLGSLKSSVIRLISVL